MQFCRIQRKISDKPDKNIQYYMAVVSGSVLSLFNVLHRRLMFHENNRVPATGMENPMQVYLYNCIVCKVNKISVKL